jgi:ribosomal protein S18 acetylase RimI-like enzyme
MPSHRWAIRRATLDDVPDLVHLRRTMFESMGYDDPAQLAAADEAANAYLSRALSEGTFYGWLAFADTGEAVGSGGAVIDRHPPGPSNLSGQSGYIMNISTDPRYRRQGIARRMMQTILRWLVEQGIDQVTLHATDEGRALYEQLGFVEGNEMVLHLEPKVPRAP